MVSMRTIIMPETIEMLKMIGQCVTAFIVLLAYVVGWCITIIVDSPSVETFKRIFLGIHGIALVLFLIWSWL